MSQAEAGALIATLGDVSPSAPTACSGWTVHDIVAHLAAGSKEIADLIEEQLDGNGSRPTRLWEDREPGFRALPHAELLAAWSLQIERQLNAQRDLARSGPYRTFEFTGMPMTAAQLDTHCRSEAAIHRWDIVGEDVIGAELLAQPDLTTHAVTILNEMPILNESVRSRFTRVHHPLTIALRAAGQPDIVLSNIDGTGGVARFEDEGSSSGAVVLTTDVAHRLLILWGRQPPRHRITIDCDAALLATAAGTLWPAAVPAPV